MLRGDLSRLFIAVDFETCPLAKLCGLSAELLVRRESSIFRTRLERVEKKMRAEKRRRLLFLPFVLLEDGNSSVYETNRTTPLSRQRFFLLSFLSLLVSDG